MITYTTVDVAFEKFAKGSKKDKDGKRSAMFSISSGANPFGIQPKVYCFSKTKKTVAQLNAVGSTTVSSITIKPSDDGYMWITGITV